MYSTVLGPTKVAAGSQPYGNIINPDIRNNKINLGHQY